MDFDHGVYNNSNVMIAREKLGKFRVDTKPEPDNIERVKKPILMLENGAKYEGEWIKDSDIRDGRGI